MKMKIEAIITKEYPNDAKVTITVSTEITIPSEVVKVSYFIKELAEKL